MELAGVPTPSMDWNDVNLLEAFKIFRQHAEVIFAGALKDKTAEFCFSGWVKRAERYIKPSP